MNYLEHINNKDNFVEVVKQQLDNKALLKLDDKKKEIANDFLSTGEQK